MKILGDMTHKEIAQALSIPIGTVQWIYNTSIKKLRHLLTALTSLALFLGGAFGYQFVRYLRTPAGIPGDVGISSIPEPEPITSPWMIAFLILFLLAVVAYVLFFKLSDRIPTKNLTKRIW